MKSETRNPNPDTSRQPEAPSDFEFRSSFGFRISSFEFRLCLLLAAVTLLAYLPVRHASFLRFDDADYVTDNGMVQSGLTWTGVKWAFTTFHASNWHPLTWLSHMLDCQLFGPGPAGPHLVNVFFHVANTLLLFVLLRRLTGLRPGDVGASSPQAGARWRSAVVAALFALHPLHVESVAWVAERKDVLSAFFFMLTLLAYGRYVAGRGEVTSHQSSVISNPISKQSVKTRSLITDHRSLTTSSPSYWLCLLLFALGLLCKPMLVTLPFVLLLLDYWPLNRVSGIRCQVSGDQETTNNEHRTTNAERADFPATHHAPRTTLPRLLLEKIPFFALAFASCVLTFLAQKQGGAVRSLTSFPISERLGNTLVSYTQYLEKLFWPFDLAIFYPHPGGWPITQVAFAAFVVAGLSLAAVRAGRRFPFAATGWFWFLGTLVPVIGLVQVSNQSLADRYTYLPYIGVFILLAWGADAAVRRWRLPRSAIGLLSGLVLVACAARTHDQLRHWRDGESLFRHALAVTDRNFVAENNLGNTLMDQGRVDEAMTHFQNALEIQPKYADALNNLGIALLEKDRVDEAIGRLEKALELQPDFVLAHSNLGNALLRKGRLDAAVAEYQKTLALKPDYANAHNNLGTALRQQGKLDQAIACYRQALKLHPHHAKAHNNLGDVLLEQGQLDEAAAQFQMAASIQPDFADAHHNLGLIRMQQGRGDEAAAHFKRVVEHRPDDAEARNNLGWCLLQTGKVDEGIAQFQQAVKIQPAFAEALNNLGFALLQQGRPREALTHLQSAVALQPDNARTLSGLAWLLATCPDAGVRNGTRAVELAEKANQLAGGQDPLILRSLAAAQAEAGRFAEALAAVRRALQLAEAQANPMLAGLLRSEMKTYEAGAPLRDTGR